jgi:hypothetical protein
MAHVERHHRKPCGRPGCRPRLREARPHGPRRLHYQGLRLYPLDQRAR